ncbi:TRAP transporter substrate-binding protein DctP [Desulfovibrio sp. OttesenSCG-928-F07]|nr:TRAP transporter substrate-binding protein DctP [Desulfovibrio sp. OttesenSCG-928-F07]
MFKFKSRLILLALTLLSISILATPAFAAKNFKNLAFASSYVERHPTYIRAWAPWFQKAEKETGGKLTFNYFSPGTLYPLKESMEAVSDGRTDFGTVVANSFPGQMNLMGAIDIPGVSPNAIVGSLTAQELVEKFPEVRAEFPPNSVPYFAWTSASYQLHTIKPLNNINDLQGRKIIVWDAVSLEVLKALGASPIRMEGADSYLALSKAMADGVYCPIAPIRSLKITEICKNHLVVNLGTGSFNMFVNKPLWDSMPADIKKWLTDNGGMPLTYATGKSLEDGQKDDIEWMEQQNHKLVYPTPEVRKPFIDRLAFFKEQWVKDCASRGISEAKAREVLKFVEERIAYHTEEMRKGTYGDYRM